MCGLYGFITNKEKSLNEEQKDIRERIIKSLAIAMEERGIDSSGMAFVKDNTTFIIKKAVYSTKFLQRNDIKKMLATQPELVLGHARQATSGIVNEKNAHPFIKGSIIGAHNGVVSNELEINGKVEVDSEVIFLLLDKNKNDFEKTFKRLSGSFAITWIDTKSPNTIYFVTHENPLALVYIHELKTIFWASTKWALRVCLMATVGLDKRDIWMPKENTVYKINPNLRIDKYKVKFKETKYVFDYRDNYNGRFPTLYKAGQDNLKNDIDFDASFEEKDNWSEADTIKYSVENFGCENCNQPINPRKGFWWNHIYESILCNNCFKESGYISGYEYYSYKNYLDLDYGWTKRGDVISEI